MTQQSIWGKEPDREKGYHGRVVFNDFDWGDAREPKKPMQELIIYEMHVRGFTKHASSGVQFPGTFEGIREKIPYLKALGITAVELMPVFEFDETMGKREIGGRTLLDYWGYNTVGFFAPNTGYTARQEYNREGTEFKNLIRELHQNGIEVILDVVFNHTAEGNEQGPFFEFKGIDNRIYYMLTPDGHYYNFSGCGNAMKCPGRWSCPCRIFSSPAAARPPECRGQSPGYRRSHLCRHRTWRPQYACPSRHAWRLV